MFSRMATEPILTLDEVAGLCGVATVSVRRWLAADATPLPSQWLGRSMRVVRPEALVRWAEERSMILLGDPHEVAKPWPRDQPAANGGSAA